MNGIRNSIASIKRRPIIIVFLTVFVLLFCILEQFNPFTKGIGTLGSLLKIDYLDNMVRLSNAIKDVAKNAYILAIAVLVAILSIFAISCIIGVLFSGYYHHFYLSLMDRKSKKGDYVSGINKHFLKISMLTAVVLILSAVFVIFLLFSIVPAVSIVKAFLHGSSEVFFPMLMVIILTCFVVYFSVVFFSMYASYLFPSLIAFKKGGTLVSFRMVNGYCWYLMPRVSGFLILLALVQIMLLAVGYGLSSNSASVGVLILNWVLKTSVLFLFTYFVFSSFKAMKDDMVAEEVE